jgi:hypothetical protein
VLSDVHLPYTDLELLSEAFEQFSDYQVDAIAFLGDLLDMPGFSTYDPVDKTLNFERDLRMLRATIEQATDVAPVVFWSLGNHERRWLRALKFFAGMQELAYMAGLQGLLDGGQLHVSDDPTLFAFGGTWMLTHPETYGRTPLVVPGQIADLYQKNVLSAHAHHWGLGRSPSGHFMVVESGGLFKPEYTEYVQRRVVPLRPWVQGYWVLRHGHPVGYPGKTFGYTAE